MFSEQDYRTAATALGVPVAAVKAVADIESDGVTHWPDGSVPILFEAQWFSSLTGHKYDASHPEISSRAWNKALYKGGPAEYGRLAEAEALDKEAALQSASWGAFQIMGFHWKELGYASPDAMVTAMQTDAGQLDAFVRFIKANVPIEDALQRQDWSSFALRYNGTGQVDYYAGKIAAAFDKYSGNAAHLPVALMYEGSTGPNVAHLQATLGIGVDGDFGVNTDRTVRAFQLTHGLIVDGKVGPQTLAALGLTANTSTGNTP